MTKLLTAVGTTAIVFTTLNTQVAAKDTTSTYAKHFRYGTTPTMPLNRGFADPNEPNDDFASAAPTTCGAVTIDTLIDPLGDVDFYLLTGTPGDIVNIDIDAAEQGSTLDPVLGTFDSALVLIDSSDDDGAPGEPATLDSYLSVTMPDDGSMFVAVSAFSDLDFDGTGAESTGVYTMSIECITLPEDPNEPNDFAAAATPIECGTATSGVVINPLGDVDFYRLATAPGQQINIDIDADETGSTLDPQMAVFDNTNSQIGFSDDDAAPGEPDTLDSYVSVQIPTDGELVIAVSAFNDDDFDGGDDAFTRGLYTLAVECIMLADADEDGVPDSTDNCTLVANPDQVDGDNDGLGNRCDADLNNSCIVGPKDIAIMLRAQGSAIVAADLNGDGLVDTADLQQVIGGLGTNPGPGAFPDQCGIANGSFETGDFTGWTTADIAAPFLPLRVDQAGLDAGFGLFVSAPTDGDFAALHGYDGTGPDLIRIGQNLFVSPATPILRFDYRIGWDLVSYCDGCSNRFFLVNVQVGPNGPVVASFPQLPAPAGTFQPDTGNRTGSIDLSEFANRSVFVSFDAFVPDIQSGPSLFQLDHVRLEGDQPTR